MAETTHSGAAIAAPSTIRALHTRYEASQTEYCAIDNADMRRGQDDASQTLGFRYQDAMKASAAESDALRLAILFQAPTDLADAAILQYHIWIQHDITTNATSASDQDKLALVLAIDALFDFMAYDVDDGTTVGQHFAAGAKRARRRRHYRHGLIGGAE